MAQTTDNGIGNPRLLEWALVLLWFCVVAAAFWWFAVRDLRGFAPTGSAALFSADQLSRVERFVEQQRSLRSGPGGALTLLHLRDPGCGCNRFADPHVAALRRDYAPRGVRVATLPVSRDRDDVADWLPATPAGLLLDAQGRILYLGPLSESANCGRDGAPVERALDQALAGHPTAAQTILGTGCYCS